MEDLSIRDPKSNLVYSGFSNEYFMKIHKGDFIKAKEYRDETLEKYINFNNVKYAVLNNEILCIHKDAFVRNKDTKYFDIYEEAEKQYCDNCFKLGINDITTVKKLSILKGEDFLVDDVNL